MEFSFYTSVPKSIATAFLPGALLAMMLLESGSVAAAPGCRLARVLVANGQTVSDVRPKIDWEPIPGVERYRLRLESRIPEGALLEAIDTGVEGTSFQAPLRLTDVRARVKVVVSEACNTLPPIDDGSWFVVDPTSRCRLEPRSVEFAGDQVRWSAVADAIEYDFQVHDMPGGKLSVSERTVRPEVRWVESPRADSVVVVRAKCTEGYGEPQYFVRPASTRP